MTCRTNAQLICLGMLFKMIDYIQYVNITDKFHTEKWFVYYIK